jgi:hypothetical protein
MHWREVLDCFRSRDFWRGFASVLDLSGSSLYNLPRRYHRPQTDEKAVATDMEAVASDWRAVGDDLRAVVKR